MSKIRKIKRAIAQNDVIDHQVHEGRTFICTCGCALPVLWLRYEDPAHKPQLAGVVAHIACMGCGKVYSSALELLPEGTESEITGKSSAEVRPQDRIRCIEAKGAGCTGLPSPLSWAA